MGTVVGGRGSLLLTTAVHVPCFAQINEESQESEWGLEFKFGHDFRLFGPLLKSIPLSARMG